VESVVKATGIIEAGPVLWGGKTPWQSMMQDATLKT
jgi:hypothetical protein